MHRMKALLMKSPALRNWRFQTTVPIQTWTVEMAGVPVSLVVPKQYIERYRADDRLGRLTGIDKYGHYEHTLAVKFKELMRPDTILFDVGSAYGLYAVYAWTLKCQQITCFEPNHLSNWILRRNNRNFCQGQLTIEKMYVSSDSLENQVDLDSYCHQHASPTLIKMDIEGYEYYAIKGMHRILENSRPTILMEFHHRKMRDNLKVEPQELLDLLRSYGYELRFNGHHWYTAQHQGEVDTDWHDSPPNDVNYALWASPT